MTDYDKQVSFRDDGVYLDGVKLAGDWASHFTIEQGTGPMDDHWEVKLTLLTGRAPSFDYDGACAESVGATPVMVRSYLWRGAEAGVESA